ncbi:MAG: hypothetical protein ACXVZP_04305, partial [Gaiellaceae bacterium]
LDRRRINRLAAGGRSAVEQPSAAAAIEAAEAERFRGAIVEPAEGAILTGLVEMLAQPADTTGALRELRLEWSGEGESWHPAEAPPEAYDVLASTGPDGDLRQVAIMQSAELAERLRLALVGSDLYRRVEVRPTQASPGIPAWREDRLAPRWDTRTVEDGEYLVRVVTVDEMGLSVESDPVRLKVDNRGPEVAFRDDLSSRTLEGIVEIEADARDAISAVDLVALELSPDGQHWQRVSEARQQPFLLRWATVELPDGRYLLRALGRDEAGNERVGEPIAVDVRNAPAAPRLDPPAGLLRGPLELIAHAGDQRTVQMIFELATSGGSEWRALGSTRAPFQLAVDTQQLPDGLFDLRVEAVAAGGQSTRSARVERRRIDNTPPAVTILEPRSRELESGPGEIVVEASAHGSGVERVELARRAGGGWSLLPVVESGSTWRCQLQLEPGDLELRVRAWDRAGNEAQHTVTLQVRAKAVIEAGAREPDLAGAPREDGCDLPAGLPDPAAAWAWREGRDEPGAPGESVPGADPTAPQPPHLHEVPRLRALDPPADEEPEESGPAPAQEEGSDVVDFPRFAAGWDIFELARLIAESPDEDPIRRVEREQVLYFLREHTSLDGRIPEEFDGLIRETFGDLADRWP